MTEIESIIIKFKVNFQKKNTLNNLKYFLLRSETEVYSTLKYVFYI